jgi:SAM-dependent methyltransferase
MTAPSSPSDDIPGARPGSVPFTAADFDAELGATAASPLIWRLAAEAAGDEYPADVEPWSDTTNWLLDRLVESLNVGQRHIIVDLACGRGGPGLWVARATGAQLVGVDWSTVAVEQATSRAGQFVAADRASFQVGTLTETGLPDASMDGAMCIDAFFFAGDRIAAAAEVCRVLRPGGVFAFTASERRPPRTPFDVPDWAPIIAAGGLEPLWTHEIPGALDRLRRGYELWLEHLDELRAEVGDDVAEELRQEAETVGTSLDGRRAVLVAARRPR